jgi:hypothetical protein
MTMIDPKNFRDPVGVLTHAIAWLEQSHGEATARQSLAFQILDQRREMLENLCVDGMISEVARKKGLRCPCSRHLEYWQTEGWKYYPTTALLDPQPNDSGSHSRTARPNGKAAASGEKEET